MVNLFSRSIGQGSPLIILHGLFGSSDNWQTFAKMVSDRYRVITVDLRNHGMSPHTDDFNFELIAGDLYKFVQDQGLDLCYLMGHSLGGKAAAAFALQYPNRVARLIILDIAMKAYPPHHHKYFDAMLGMNFDLIKNRIEADAWLQQGISNLAIRQFILKNLVRDEEGRFRWRFNLKGLYRNYDSINVAIESKKPFPHPTLIVSGEYSDYIQPEDLDQMKILFPFMTTEVIAQSGHWVHADQAGRLKEVVVEFLG